MNAYMTVYWFTTGYKFGYISLTDKREIEIYNKMIEFYYKLDL